MTRTQKIPTARVRIKICGITRGSDAWAAAEHGADAIGLVFYPHSPRAVNVGQALEILAGLPPFLTRVGLFVDTGEDEIRALLKHVALDVLQFHGDEPPEYCRSFGKPYVKAIRVREGVDIPALCRIYADASALLLDSFVTGSPGGSGQTFDWAAIPEQLEKPIILAGGLSPDNVASAIAAARPYAVDVSGGVERAKGIKDEEKLRRFMRTVWDARLD
ncbi:MAG: phosphoribosylanthranilate isomerase [Gammaproteobacteria bacterium]